MKSTDLTAKEVAHLAKLANVKLTPEKSTEFQTELTSIVGYVGEVQKIELENVQPTAQVTGKVNEFRQDIVTPSLSQSESISQASKSYQGYFIVPAVLKS